MYVSLFPPITGVVVWALLYKYLIYVKRGQPFGLPSLVSLPLVRFSFVTRTAPTGLPPPSGTPSINRARVLLRVRLITEKLTDSKKLLYKYLIYTRKGNCVAIPFSVILLPLARFSFVTRTAPTGLPPPSGTPSINRGRVLLRVTNR